MLKLMIVDDEYLIRQYIRNCIDWEEIGYTIVGEMESAQGALRLAKQIQPDVVLTDICMPGLDGLSFAGMLKDVCPSVRVIAITGHDDFEYAQRGIRVGLDNYLLKPIDETELRNVALDIKADILSKRTQENLFQELSDYRKQNEPIVREYYLKKLLEPGFPQKLSDEKIIKSLLPGEECFYQVIVLCVDDFSQILLGNDIKKGNSLWIKKYLTEKLDDKTTSWVLDKFEHIVVLCQKEGFPWRDFLEALESEWQQKFHFPVYYGIGEGEREVKNIYRSYMQASSHLNSAVAFGNNQYQQEKIYSRFEDTVTPISIDDLKKLYTYIETDSPGKLEELIQSWFEKWKNVNLLDLLYLKLQLLNAVFYIYSMNTRKVDPDDFQKEYKEYYRRIFQIPTLKLLQDCFTEMCRKILDTFHDEKSARPSNLIFAVKEYINSHIADMDLSLVKAAGEFYLNSSYLSRIFKQEAGVSFIEYVNSLRVEKAKVFLRDTDLKVYEIAEKVGIENANYLGIIFKKNVGCSPYEYRNRNKK